MNYPDRVLCHGCGRTKAKARSPPASLALADKEVNGKDAGLTVGRTVRGERRRRKEAQSKPEKPGYGGGCGEGSTPEYRGYGAARGGRSACAGPERADVRAGEAPCAPAGGTRRVGRPCGSTPTGVELPGTKESDKNNKREGGERERERENI